MQFADRGGLFPEKPDFSRRRSPAWEKVHTYFIFNPDIPQESERGKKRKRAKEEKGKKKSKPGEREKRQKPQKP